MSSLVSRRPTAAATPRTLLLAFALALGAARVEPSGLEGRVLDAAGSPVAGVRVLVGEICRAMLYYNAPDGAFTATPGVPDAERARYAAELTSDRDGRFAVTGLAPGEYSVLAVGGERGFALASTRIESSATSKLEMSLEPPSYVEVEVTGHDFDPRCHVVELAPLRTGANLKLVPRLAQPPKGWSFKSAPLPRVDGWRVTGTELVQSLGFSATLFSEPVTVAPGERRSVRIDLATGAKLAGSVSDAQGAPLAGVSIVLRGPLDSQPLAERGAVTDARGRYEIRGLPPGRFACTVARWTLRQLAGCGRGTQDVGVSREIEITGDGPTVVDLRADLIAAPLELGEPAPPFRAETLAGGTVDLASLRGKVVLIDFWATWCGICRMEMPRLAENYARYSRDGRFEIVGVSVDDDLALVPRFVAGRGFRWPQTALGPAQSNPIARLYGVNSTPSTVLVDAEGRVVALNSIGDPLWAKVAELLGSK